MGHRFLIGMVVIAGLLGAGCGGDDEGDGNGGGSGAGSGGSAAGSGGAGSGGSAAGAGGAGSGGGDMACVTGFMAQGQTAECASCACSMCATEIGNLEALATDQRALADGVLTCARTNCCSGTPCYCGDADTATCAMAMPPAGDCVAEIEMAAGATGLLGIAGPAGMPTTALGAASALGRCLNGDTTMNVMGKCPACVSTCN